MRLSLFHFIITKYDKEKNIVIDTKCNEISYEVKVANEKCCFWISRRGFRDVSSDKL